VSCCAFTLAMLILFVYGLNTSTGMVVFSSTVQGAVPDGVRGRVFTLLDVSWNAMRLFALAIGGLVVDTLGIRPLFWGGGLLLALAGVLGLVLLGSYDFRQEPTEHAPSSGSSSCSAGAA
jgi:MFS family permease